MNYSEVTEYLFGLSKRGIKPGLTSIGELNDALGNPTDNLKFIHVAGTNGKGSVTNFIACVLRAAGYKVGVYSTPAVFKPLEIISVNGVNISKDDYASLASEIKELSEHNGFAPTAFEVETAIAFKYFEIKKCDIVVLETGMGGRLDATNIIKKPLVCVFTPISFDHMSFLGNSIEEIAAEKAGIIKEGAYVVSAEQLTGAAPVISEAASSAGNEALFVKPSDIKKVSFSKDHTRFDYKDLKQVNISMLGERQPENAALAIEALKALEKAGMKISEKAFLKGLHNAFLPGRFEIVSTKPYVILDGAHNEAASKELNKNVIRYLGKKKIIYILSVLKDKEYDKVIKATLKDAFHVITCQSPNKARALSAIDIANSVKEVNTNVSAADSIDEAVELSLLLADKDTAIVVFGSFTHLSDVRTLIERKNLIAKDFHGIEEI